MEVGREGEVVEENNDVPEFSENDQNGQNIGNARPSLEEQSWAIEEKRES